MTRKRFLLTVVLPIIAAVIIGILIISLNSSSIINSRAAALVSSEKDELTSEIKNLKDEKAELEKQSNEYDKVLEENSKYITDIETLQSELESYTSDVEAAKIKDDDLTKQLEAKQQYLSGLEDVSAEETKGTPKKLSKGDYSVPSDIKAGRYVAEGTCKIYVFTISNEMRLKEDLATIDSNSFTFEIESGETFRADGDVTITEITE